MSRVLAYHLILTCYGFWLPNDPRGSWSTFVRSFELFRVGGLATKTDSRRSVASVSHDRDSREATKLSLTYPPVLFNGKQARAVMRGIGDYVVKNNRYVHAAAIMPDHVHLVVGRSDLVIEKIADQMKARATTFLNRASLHPLQKFANAQGRAPSPWARSAWQVYLDKPGAIQRAIRYVQNNPIKAGLKPQCYEWVTPYVG